MRGIILAGGEGTRLRPHTYITNKHLLPVYDKPMIYYPLKTLVDMGCDDIMIVSGGEHIGGFSELLENGRDYGISLSYRVQSEPGGVAQALSYADDFVEQNGPQQIVPVILGDNYFEVPITIPSEQAIVVKEVDQPERFGVYDPNTRTITEKPTNPLGKLAVIGLYFYKPRTIRRAKTLMPSDRGEMEITDLNNYILKDHETQIITYDKFWSDMGTHDTLLEVANYVKNRSI